MRRFGLLLVGQSLSQAGTLATTFALGVWVFERTRSVTLFSTLVVSSMLTGIVVAPLAGVLADRHDRRWLMLLGQAGACASVVAMALAHRAGLLSLPVLLPLLVLHAAFEALLLNVFSASTALLVPEGQLDRANGMVQLGDGIALIAAPTAAGLLLPAIGLGGIFLIDIATFLYAISVLWFVRVPRVPGPPREGAGTFLREARAGLDLLRAEPGLSALLMVGLAGTFVMAMVQLLFSPLILGFAGPSALGIIESVGGVGFLAGSVALSIWGGPRRRAGGVLVFMSLQAGVLFLAAARPSVVLAGVGCFLVLATLPFIMGLSQTLWQRRVPLDLQGRVFAFRTMAGRTVYTLASLCAGPLSDGLFEPWMRRGGVLEAALGPLLGAGPGRGVALLFVALGGLLLCAALAGRLHPALGQLDDAVAAEPPRES